MKKIWCFLITTLLVVVCALTAVACGEAENASQSKSVTSSAKYVLTEEPSANGITFSDKESFTVEKLLDTVPRTIETYIYVPAAVNSGNYAVQGTWASNNYVGMDVMLYNASPRLHFSYYDEINRTYFYNNYIFNTNGASANAHNVTAGTDQATGTLVFDVTSSEFINNGTIKIPSDTWVHMVMTLDTAAHRLNLYLNGTLIAHFNNFVPEGYASNFSDLSTYRWKVGGDARTGNTSYFKGSMKMSATYTTVRTAEEIASDYTRISGGTMIGTDTDDMIFGYDLTAGYPALTEDHGPKNNNLLVSAAAKPGYVDRSNIVAGVTFTKGNSLKLPDGTINAQPLTFEAVFRLTANYTSRGGTIFGNYGGTTSGNRMVTQMEVRNKGIPAIYLQNDAVNTGASNYGFGASSASSTFLPRGEREMIQLGNPYEEARGTNNPSAKTGQIEVATGDWVHMVMIHNPDEKMLELYLDGILISRITGVESSKGDNYKFTPNGTYYIGGDGRETDANSIFKGELRSLAVYSDIRTEEEIFQSFLRKPGDEFESDANLMCAYDFTRNKEEFLKDMSGRGKDLIATAEFLNKYASTDNDGEGYDGDGMLFHYDEFVTLQKALPAIPKTIEANVLLPMSYSGTGYTIFSNLPDTYPYSANYKESFHVSPAFMSFEATNNGLRFYYVPADDTDSYREVYDITMEHDIKTGMWQNVAVVIDDTARAIIFYVDGKEIGRNSALYAPFNEDVLKKNFMIGGNYREGNQGYFRGSMRSLVVFSDARTAAEIASDCNGVADTEAGLIAKYNLNVTDYGTIQDLSSSDVDATYECLWKSEGLALDSDDYAYSFAVIGDTQMLNCKFSTRHAGIYEWIVDNWDDKKIAHVFGLGDITETNEVIEWENAKAASDVLAANNKPYSLLLGNHDNNNMFDRYYRDLDNTGYCDQFDGFYEYANGTVNVTNSYKLFDVGSTKYLFITLDYGCADELLEWAGDLCDKYPDRRVIISTHSYVSRDGTLYSHGEYGDPNQRNETLNCGDEMWEKMVKNHGNIFLVLSGHDHWDNIETVQMKGIHGNTVTQMLIDPQSVDTHTDGSGIVAMLYFSADGSKMWVEYISSTRELLGEENSYYKANNQFTIELDTESSFNAHNRGQYAIAKALKVGATCTSYAEYYYSCECGAVFDGETFFGTQLGSHRYLSYVSNNDATCTANGTETAKCAYCTKTRTRTDSDSMLGHTFADNHACHDRLCDTCGDSVAASTEHRWNAGTVLEAPTTTSEGRKVYTCTDCGEAKSEVIEKLSASEGDGGGSTSGGKTGGGCSKESVGLALAAMATLIAAAFVIKK